MDKGKDVQSSTPDLGCEAGLQCLGTRPEARRQAEVRAPAQLVPSRGLIKLPRLQSGLGSGGRGHCRWAWIGRSGLCKGSESSGSDPEIAQVGDRLIRHVGRCARPATAPCCWPLICSPGQRNSQLQCSVVPQQPRGPCWGPAPKAQALGGVEDPGRTAGQPAMLSFVLAAAQEQAKGLWGRVGSQKTSGRCGQELSVKGDPTPWCLLPLSPLIPPPPLCSCQSDPHRLSHCGLKEAGVWILQHLVQCEHTGRSSCWNGRTSAPVFCVLVYLARLNNAHAHYSLPGFAAHVSPSPAIPMVVTAVLLEASPVQCSGLSGVSSKLSVP